MIKSEEEKFQEDLKETTRSIMDADKNYFVDALHNWKEDLENRANDFKSTTNDFKVIW